MFIYIEEGESEERSEVSKSKSRVDTVRLTSLKDNTAVSVDQHAASIINNININSSGHSQNNTQPHPPISLGNHDPCTR